MFSKFVKIILVSTSLSPILLTLTYLSIHKGRPIDEWFPFLGAAMVLFIACIGIIYYSKKTLEEIPLAITELRNADKEILGFFLVYLIPFISYTSLSYDPYNIAFVFGILSFVLWNSDHSHFNPVLGLIGYHFYEVKSTGNVSYILITKKTLQSVPIRNFRTVKLAAPNQAASLEFS